MGKRYQQSHAFKKVLEKHSIIFKAFEGSESPQLYSEVFRGLTDLFHTQYAPENDSVSTLANNMATSLVESPLAHGKYKILVGRITDQLNVGLHIGRQGRPFKMNTNQTIRYDEKNRSLSNRRPPQYTVGLKDDKLERHLGIHRARRSCRTTFESDPFVTDHFVTNSLHFPFLFVHADPDGNLTAVKDQYAFPVWRLLAIQQALQEELVTKKFSTRPLVWTIAICGTTVRIGGGYIKPEDGKVFSVGYAINLSSRYQL